MMMTTTKSTRTKTTPYQPLGNYDFVQSSGYASLRDLYNNKQDPMWAGFADGALRYCSDNAHWIRRAWMDFDEVVSDWMYTLATPAAGKFDPTRASPIAHGRLWFGRVLVRVMRTYAQGIDSHPPVHGNLEEEVQEEGDTPTGLAMELASKLVDSDTPECQYDSMGVLHLQECIDALSQHNDRQAQTVELRIIGGLTSSEIAATLGVSMRTVARDLAGANRWLQNYLSNGATQ